MMVDNVAELAAKAYRVRAAFLERASRRPNYRNMSDTVKTIREWAEICRKAAMAEETDTGAKLS